MSKSNPYGCSNCKLRGEWRIKQFDNGSGSGSGCYKQADCNLRPTPYGWGSSTPVIVEGNGTECPHHIPDPSRTPTGVEQTLSQLVSFITAPGQPNRMWLQSELLEVYVRNTQRSVGGAMLKCLDLANIIATYRGHGVFTEFLAKAEKLCDEHRYLLYIENVLTDRFSDFFKRREYQRQSTDDPNTSWVRPPKH